MTVIHGAAIEYAGLEGRRSADPLTGVPDASLSLRLVEVPPGARTAHRHPHSAEVVYVAAGRGSAWVDGERTPVEVGDVLHIPAGAAHATVAVGDEPLRLVCFFPRGDLETNRDELSIVVEEQA